MRQRRHVLDHPDVDPGRLQRAVDPPLRQGESDADGEYVVAFRASANGGEVWTQCDTDGIENGFSLATKPSVIPVAGQILVSGPTAGHPAGFLQRVTEGDFFLPRPSVDLDLLLGRHTKAARTVSAPPDGGIL